MNAYFEQMIVSASPLELVCLMYDQAIASVREARAHLQRKNVTGRSKAIMRAYDILTELISALRPAEAPEIAAQLRRLYLYLQGILLKANGEQTDEPLAEAVTLLTTLSDAWKQVPDANRRELAAVAA
jgi:flagellar protein FliS